MIFLAGLRQIASAHRQDESARALAADWGAPPSWVLPVSVALWVLNRPDGGDLSNKRGRLIQDRRAVHFQDRNVAVGVVPQNVAHAVAVVVARSGDRPGGRDLRNERGRLIQDGRAVHFQDRNVTVGVMPQNVAHAVAVEVTGSDNRPGGGDVCDKRG